MSADPYSGWTDHHVERSALLSAPAFSFERTPDGRPHRKTARARVTIGQRVELFDQVVIDRGLERNTVLGDDVKVGAGAHIGHDAVLGDRVVVCPGALIGGFAEIGDDVTVGLGARVKNRVRIGAGAKVGIGAVVIDDVPAGATVFGNPARVVATKSPRIPG